MNAQSVLSSISSNRALWLAQYHAEVRKRDEISNLEGAKEMGRAKGLAEGLSKGRAEGEKNILTKLAEFSKQGLSLEEIMRLLSQ